MKAEITGGSNFERHLYFVEAGSADLRVTHAGTPIGGGRTATGVHLLPVSNTFDSAPPDQTISAADITIAHADVNRRMTGLSYAVKGRAASPTPRAASRRRSTASAASNSCWR